MGNLKTGGATPYGRTARQSELTLPGGCQLGFGH